MSITKSTRKKIIVNHKGREFDRMRPMDFKGLHRGNAEPFCEMPTLPLRLRTHHLSANHHLCRIQVRSKKQELNISQSPNFLKISSVVTKLYSAHAIHGIWTWVLFATWTRDPWQCGNRASWRLTGTKRPAMSTKRQGHWDWSIQTPCMRGSSYPRSPRLSY